MKIGLEESRILARAEGSFHMRNTKNSTLGTKSNMSQYRTLGQKNKCYTIILNYIYYSVVYCLYAMITWNILCLQTRFADIYVA